MRTKCEEEKEKTLYPYYSSLSPFPLFNSQEPQDTRRRPTTTIITITITSLIPLSMLQYDGPSAPMPPREQDPAMATLMLRVLETVDEVGDAAETDEDAG